MKLLSLSKFFIVYLLLTLLSGQVSGQYDYWSNAVPFTDSVTNNINPTVSLIPFPDYKFYVFWERSTDETSLQLRKITKRTGRVSLQTNRSTNQEKLSTSQLS